MYDFINLHRFHPQYDVTIFQILLNFLGCVIDMAEVLSEVASDIFFFNRSIGFIKNLELNLKINEDLYSLKSLTDKE